MKRNYLIVSLRYLRRNKEYSIVNILGLSVGVTCCLLIAMFIRSELNYDAFHSKSDNLYRIWQREIVENNTNLNVVTPLPTAEAVKSGIPEISEACRIYNFSPVIKIDNASFTENVDMVDPSLFSMFDFPVLAGGISNPLQLQNAVVLTSSAAKKFFGSADVIGKTVGISLNDTSYLFTVTAVVADVPEASSIKFKALIPFANAVHLFNQRAFHSWFDVFCETYVLVKPGAKYISVESKLPQILRQNLGSDFGKEDFTMHLQNIKDIHLGTGLPAGNEPISNPKYSYILGTIGLLLLVVACINFITLSVSQSTKRALEVGVRKTLGASRTQLILQFWGDAFLVVLVSIIIGICATALLLNPFNMLVNKQLVMHFDLAFILICFTLAILISIVSGIYPALVLSAFKPAEVLKGKMIINGEKGWFRKGLVVGQFATSIIMIIGTIIIGQQMRYLEMKDLGYNKNQVIIVETNKPRKFGLPL
ncbi:MAG TPA: ABC transporter permease, partial [Puia sp.]|nr:ABC transporter permease [Puia sp.]